MCHPLSVSTTYICPVSVLDVYDMECFYLCPSFYVGTPNTIESGSSKWSCSCGGDPCEGRS